MSPARWNGEGLTIPLLIGGATTRERTRRSRSRHHYEPPVVHVLDASRAVPVVGQLMKPETRQAPRPTESQASRRIYASNSRPAATTRDAHLRMRRCAKLHTEWDDHDIAVPEFTGRRVLKDFPLSELVPFIDWSPFFHTWELRGRYPASSGCGGGPAARELFANAQGVVEKDRG